MEITKFKQHYGTGQILNFVIVTQIIFFSHSAIISVQLPLAPGMFLSGYKSVRNKLLTSVDLPKPDSPEINKK